MNYKELEKQFKEWVGYDYAIALNSGTSALHLALLAMGIKEGDEVIVPDFTFASCAFAVSYCRATPVFVDCDDTYNINVDLIEESITDKTKVIMPVHVYGRKCNMDRIHEIAKRYNLLVLEDMSEGHGIQPSGDIAIYSFQSTKIIHAEEGGILVTNNEKWNDEISLRKTLANQGDYFHPFIGFNYRMPDSQAKLALESLNNIQDNLKKRREIESELKESYPHGKYRDVVWVYDILYPTEQQRDIALRTIPNSRPFFKPLSSLPMYNKSVRDKSLDFSKRGLVLKIL